jgi:hypothetical protein
VNKEDDGHAGPWVAGPEILEEEATQKKAPKKKKPYARKPPRELPLGENGKPTFYLGKETDQKRAFAAAYVETRSWKLAFQSAYSWENQSDTMIRVNAYRIKSDPFVKSEIKRLFTDLEERAQLSRLDVINMLMEDRELAYEHGHSAAAVQASWHLAQIMNYADKTMKVHVTHDIDQMDVKQLRAYLAENAALLSSVIHSPLQLEDQTVDAEYVEVE